MTILDARPEIDTRDPWVRIERLADPGTVTPIDAGEGGVAAALVRLDGVPAVVFATDARVQGGAMGADGCNVLCHAYSEAVHRRVPIVGIWQSGGARLADGVASLHGVGKVFAAMTRASGVVPQVSLVLGPAAGGAAYGPALTDVVVLAPEARVFVTGADIVREVTGETVDAGSLGGPAIHGERSGLAHIVALDDEDAHRQVRRVTRLLAVGGHVGSIGEQAPDPGRHIPENERRAYDMRPVIRDLLDEGSGCELQPKWASNVITSLGRIGGRSVGVVANQPMRKGGCLDAQAAEKAARFVRLCDAFGLPIVTLVDVPGYLPGVKQEWDGVVRRGAKLLHAYAACTVPCFTVIVRKAYGGAYIAMSSRSLGATVVYAWPGAVTGVMGSLPAVRLLHRKKIAATAPEDRPALEERLVAEHEEAAGGVRAALDSGLVDAQIEPAQTRRLLAAALNAHDHGARGPHGNIPL
jgi:acetyl-CoA/propionyl-CoA carboxylase carboxyl transferase subunit